MKIFHTADWHLGKIVQGQYMTEDQAYALDHFIQDVEREQPDIIIIAGDLYDRAVPPTEAVDLLNDIFERLVLKLKVPVLAIAGNHDSPDRIGFAVKLMEKNGLHMVGQLQLPIQPVTFHDDEGAIQFYLVPYADPAVIRHLFGQDEIKTHQDAMDAIVQHIQSSWDPAARHVFVGHAFVTPYGEQEENTSDSERPLSIGGAEYVNAECLQAFDYVALGHLHQAHQVGSAHIQYAGSPLKYSISEENHKKGYLTVELAGEGVEIEKVLLPARRDMRRVIGKMDEIERHAINEDYVYVTLTDENPVLFPMEKIRAVYPNAMHVERSPLAKVTINRKHAQQELAAKQEMRPVELFRAFYEEVRGTELSEDKQERFASIYEQLMKGGM